MTIGRLVDRAEPPVRRSPACASCRRRSVRRRCPWPALSMGMSDDFEVAVEEGATIVRVGRALFGARP